MSPWGFVPVPGHHGPAYALHSEVPCARDHLRTVPAVRDAEDGGNDARCFVYRFLPTLEFLLDRAWSAPGQVRVGEGVVADGVFGGDLGRQVGLAHDVVSDHEKGGLYLLTPEDFHELCGVRVAGSVVEGKRDDALSPFSRARTRVRRSRTAA